MSDVGGGKDIAHNPSMEIGRPPDFSGPFKRPSVVYALMYPSPKLPTRMILSCLSSPVLRFASLSSPSSSKKEPGASATPQGAFRAPLEANLFIYSPLVL